MDVYVTYSVFFTLACVSTGVIWFYLNQLPYTPALKWFRYVLLVCLGILVTQYLEISLPTLSIKIFMLNVRFIFYSLIAPFVLFFTSAYTGKKLFLPGKLNWMLVIFPIFFILLAFTSPYHQLFRFNFSLNNTYPLATVVFERGAFLYLSLLYNTVLGVYSFYIWVTGFRHGMLRREELIISAIASLLPIVIEVFFSVQKSPVPGFNFGPISLCFSTLLYLLGFWRFRLFNIMPIAHDLVVRNLANFVLIINQQNQIVEINEAFKNELGISKLPVGSTLQALPRNWVEIITENMSGEKLEKNIVVAEGRRVKEFTLRAFPIRDNDEFVVGYVFTWQDITRRKEIETQIMAQQIMLGVSAERERLARDIHDTFGQVIAMVDSHTQSLQMLLQNGRVKEGLEKLSTIQQIVKSGQTDLRKNILNLRSEETTIDFLTVINAYLQEFKQATGIHTVFHHPSLPNEKFLDTSVENQAIMILQEALANIRKHAKAQKIELLMTLGEKECILIISDDGIGFDPASAPTVVTGHFGMKIMRERAEQVGGRLEVSSKPNDGTRLLLHLPLQKAVINTKVPQAIPERTQKIRVVLADDHALFREGLKNLLEARNMQVVGIADNGHAAIELAREKSPDVVILDLNMPILNGLQASHIITSELPNTRVVILTISDDRTNLIDAFRTGASGYLLKNLEANKFCDLLGDIVRGEIVISPELAQQILIESVGMEQTNAKSKDSLKTELNSKQLEILELVSQGITYKEIGAILSLSEKTIKYHMAQILDILRVDNRAQAIAYMQKMRK